MKEKIKIPIWFEIEYEKGFRDEVIEKINPHQDQLGGGGVAGNYRIKCLGIKKGGE